MRGMKALMSGLIVLAYSFALVMSAGHLAKWYSLTLGDLPQWFAVGLAAALETAAFILSLLSNSLLKGSPWANSGAITALGLVWAGNYLSMRRAGEAGTSPLEVGLMSMFVPVSTFWLAKVLGELLSQREEGRAGETGKTEREERERREKGEGGREREREGERTEERGSLPRGERTGREEESPPEVREGEEEAQGEERNPKEVFAELIARGKSVEEARRAVGIAQSTAYRWLKEIRKGSKAAV